MHKVSVAVTAIPTERPSWESFHIHIQKRQLLPLIFKETIAVPMTLTDFNAEV
jgi:hypothetical protein